MTQNHAHNVRLAEVVGALSYALDLTEGQPDGHALRCCWIGMHIGRVLGLDDAALSDLHYTLLLKDVGCSSNAARLCQLYLADDLCMKRDYKFVDNTLPQLLGFILSHTGVKQTLSERFRALIDVVRNGGEYSRELIETRCNRGAQIARQMRFSESVANGILDLDEHWNGKGLPLGRAGGEIALAARIALLSQVVDVFFMADGPKGAMREVRQRSGSWFDPALVAVFEQVAADPWFWEGLGAGDIEARVVALEPVQHSVLVDEDYLDDLAAGFAQVVDSKSPYTAGHSDRVGMFTDMIAEELSLGDDKRRWLRRAALLHDIGKLGISNQVLDKPGKLDDDEWADIKRHPILGETILMRITAFSDMAVIAATHHEKLDGTGYPRGLDAADLSLDTRIIAVADIFDALTAERPYRAALPVGHALEVMREMAGSAIDPDCLAALERAVARLDAQAA
ncbi:HD-GYP domain-containing protein [Devosia sp.]|uniref:HD-GYP domain-containing protein n=1 Tax=Devosia sp. TaxID=1871048 RepID=UPI003A93D369